VLACILAALLLGVAPRSAAAAGFATAQDYFYDADFELALETLDTVLADESLAGTDRRDAEVLRARCHARLGHDAEAIDAYCEAVREDPAWNPDPATFSSDEMALFRRALASCPLAAAPPTPPEPGTLASGSGNGPDPLPPAGENGGSWYTSRKLWIGTGALLVLLAVAGASSAEEDPAPIRDNSVPDFPDPPTGAPFAGAGIRW
jgi:hypothetical protein